LLLTYKLGQRFLCLAELQSLPLCFHKSLSRFEGSFSASRRYIDGVVVVVTECRFCLSECFRGCSCRLYVFRLYLSANWSVRSQVEGFSVIEALTNKSKDSGSVVYDLTSRIVCARNARALYGRWCGSYRGVSYLSKQVFQGLLAPFLCRLVAYKCQPGQRDVKKEGS
jgi:hypothetical protein